MFFWVFLLLLHSNTTNNCLHVVAMKIAAFCYLPSVSLEFREEDLMIPPRLQPCPFCSIWHALYCLLPIYFLSSKPVTLQLTTILNYNLNKIIWEMEWAGEKPTVHVKVGLDIEHTLRYNFPSWLTQKEKCSVAHPREAVMSKGVQAIVSVPLFAYHPPLPYCFCFHW